MAFSFLFSVLALLVLVWSLSRNLLGMGPSGGKKIFDNPAEPDPESILLSDQSVQNRFFDQSCSPVVRYLFWSSCIWLLVGSIVGMIVSLKFNFPDWLSELPALTFGRLRPLHLNVVAYGWVSMVGMAISIWLVPRLTKNKLSGGATAVLGTHLWNLGMLLGTVSLLAGWTDGVEWLEFPWATDWLFIIGGAMIGFPVLLTLRGSKEDHIYVSLWYIGAAFVWFPFLFLVANLPVFYGAQHAIVNWWYAHNVLGLWITPMGLAAAYYLIPKIIGQPIYSYQVSLLGFWGLALFYSQVGIHHLIGGPVPTWLVSLSVVTSVMMFIPVIAVAVNHHFTIGQNWARVKQSPTLQFVVFGAMMYTVVSAQGSLMALRSINQVSHFTHYTVGHAHLGVYGFFTFIAFGACYFMLPRIFQVDWPRPKLIRWHFWLAVIGIAIYVGSLSIGGILQGQKMLNPEVAFSESVAFTKPWLAARSLGGLLMTLSHIIFFYHAILLWMSKKEAR